MTRYEECQSQSYLKERSIGNLREPTKQNRTLTRVEPAKELHLVIPVFNVKGVKERVQRRTPHHKVTRSDRAPWIARLKIRGNACFKWPTRIQQDPLTEIGYSLRLTPVNRNDMKQGGSRSVDSFAYPLPKCRLILRKRIPST